MQKKRNWGDKTRHRLAMFLLPFTSLPFTGEDSITAGKLRGYLEKQGNPIGSYDVQIATQGLSRGITVITHNTSEFSRISNLQFENTSVSVTAGRNGF